MRSLIELQLLTQILRFWVHTELSILAESGFFVGKEVFEDLKVKAAVQWIRRPAGIYRILARLSLIFR